MFPVSIEYVLYVKMGTTVVFDYKSVVYLQNLFANSCDGIHVLFGYLKACSTDQKNTWGYIKVSNDMTRDQHLNPWLFFF